MKPLTLARIAAIAAVVVLGVIGCGAGAGQSPTVVGGNRSSLATQSPSETQSLNDRITATDLARAGIVLGEFRVAEEMAQPATPGSPDSGEVGGGAISALPTPGLVDDQGNLRQPEPGDALIDFTLPRAGGGEITLSEIGRDQNTVLVFYRAFW